VGRIVSYRCGIKTCSRCCQFVFRVPAKALCVWDEASFQPFFADSAAFHGFDDAFDMHNWKDDEALAPHSVNESLLWKAEMRNFAGDVDVKGSDHVIKMDRRFVKTVEDQYNGVKASALDDDEDVD